MHIGIGIYRQTCIGLLEVADKSLSFILLSLGYITPALVKFYKMHANIYALSVKWITIIILYTF